MNANLCRNLAGFLGSALVFCFAGVARAQAPEGPQGGKQQQGVPPVEPKPPPPQQKAQDYGASIAVEVPVVTMDVIAATNRADLLTGLKKANFLILDAAL